MGLLRTLAIIILVYYGFKLLARFVFPFLLQMFVKKAQQNMQNQFQQQQHQKPEGEVTIQSKAQHKQHISTENLDVEDVDFEDVN